MALKLGTADIDDVKVGTAQIDKIYQGTTLVWSAA